MTTASLTFCRSLLLAAPVVFCTYVSAHGQDSPFRPPATAASGEVAAPVEMSSPASGYAPGAPGQPPHMPRSGPGKAGGPPDMPTSGPPGKSGKGDKPADAMKPIRRPAKPETPPDPNELKAGPDKKGLFKLNFNGQQWLPVLQWLADHSKMSLDWQEVPGDYLNLRTQRSYKINEVRDLINRRLLDRGYTLLCDGESLIVVSTKNLNVAVVPRVEPEELAKRDPYEFVKVSFALDCLTAEVAARELAPMKSSNGRLSPMVDGNRVEAMDTVTNLREMYAALEHEQSTDNRRRSVRKFKLHHARAEDVIESLQALVGGEAKSPTRSSHSSQNSQEARQMAIMRAMQQQQQQQQGGQQGQPPAALAAKVPTAFVVNQRENSIVATAPADKMAIIAQVITAVDVQVDGDSLDAANQTQVYRLAGVEPEPIVKTLEEIGHLSPTAHLEADKKNKLIIADGTSADHAAIRALVDRLCGSDRSFEVIRLRWRRAERVAPSIEFMMGVDSKKKKNEDSHRWWPWDDDSSNSNDKTGDFRVHADIEQNRLLLWANKIEMGQVQDLLVKLGEVPPKVSTDRIKQVTIDGGNAKETEELLKRIRAEWPQVAPNPLSTPLPASEKSDKVETPVPSNSEVESPTAPSKTTAAPPKGTIVRLTDLRRETPVETGAGASDKNGNGSAYPVDVRVRPDGRLDVFSKDAQALELFEELANELATPHRDYEVFRLRRASAWTVRLNLEDFFKEEPKKDKIHLPDYIRYEYDIDEDALQGSDEGLGLSKRRKLKFLDDTDANIILVSGATASQLKTIRELIEMYDKPPPVDTELAPQSRVFYLRHSKAKAVRDTLKDVFRDLLSESDKAQGGNQNQRERRRFSMFGFEDSGDGESGRKVPKLKTPLSIGILEESNALVVSAPTYVFRNVADMIENLDKGAEANNAVRVLKVSHDVTPERLREILNAIQGRGTPGAVQSGTPPRSKPDSKPSGSGEQGHRPHGN